MSLTLVPECRVEIEAYYLKGYRGGYIFKQRIN